MVEVDGRGWDLGSHIGGHVPRHTRRRLSDIDYYLQATATYGDGLGTGRDSTSAVTTFAVEERPVANSQPAFADADDVDGWCSAGPGR